MTRYLHTMYRITDPARSRGFYEALGLEFRRELPIVRNGVGTSRLRSTILIAHLLACANRASSPSGSRTGFAKAARGCVSSETPTVSFER
jgi:catechol 2,3-dioxygenase-like lactoylglutathione lyase family enzyme